MQSDSTAIKSAADTNAADTNSATSSNDTKLLHHSDYLDSSGEPAAIAEALNPENRLLKSQHISKPQHQRTGTASLYRQGKHPAQQAQHAPM